MSTEVDHVNAIIMYDNVHCQKYYTRRREGGGATKYLFRPWISLKLWYLKGRKYTKY